jgi:hypothetical protein
MLEMQLTKEQQAKLNQKPAPKPATPSKPQTTVSTAITAINNFELAGKMKAIDQKAVLLEVARNAYRDEMSTLSNDIAEMLAEEDMSLDVADFFGVGQLTLEIAPETEALSVEVLV